MNHIKKIEKLKSEESIADIAALDFAEVHKKSLINLNEKPSYPPLAISIGYDDVPYKGDHYPLRFGTFGNISMIKGEEKSRKTFLKHLILSCIQGGKANLFSENIYGHNLESKFIVDIDTEQDELDAWRAASRIPQMVGALPENYIPVKLREYTPVQRCQYIEWLFMESPMKENLGVVSIDGYVDCLEDFNSLKESSEFTQKLMKWSSISKSHVTGILHLNPNSDKARGHLGTILQQKCETVVIIKDMGEYSEVTCQRGRGKKFRQFSIGVNKDWLPYEIEEGYSIVEAVNQTPKANF